MGDRRRMIGSKTRVCEGRTQEKKTLSEQGKRRERVLQDVCRLCIECRNEEIRLQGRSLFW